MAKNKTTVKKETAVVVTPLENKGFDETIKETDKTETCGVDTDETLNDVVTVAETNEVVEDETVPSIEESADEEEKDPEPEMIAPDSFTALVKPMTAEERSLCDMIQQYIDISYKEASTARDGEDKLTLLIKILFYPYSASIGDPSAMFNIIRTFFTKERRMCLAEAYVSQKAHLMSEKQFKEFINIYTTFVALIDAKANKVLFRINLNTLLATLGTKYQAFVNWLTVESEKINKLANS